MLDVDCAVTFGARPDDIQGVIFAPGLRPFSVVFYGMMRFGRFFEEPFLPNLLYSHASAGSPVNS